MRERIPSKKWIGKIIEIIKDSTISIIKGSDAYSAEVFKSQLFKVVGVKSGYWLEVVSVDKLNFTRQPGIQMSESEVEYHEKEYGKYGNSVSDKGIVFGISIKYDRHKFRVV